MLVENLFQTSNSKRFKGKLYLDETNNFRKLYLTEKGANNEFENLSFVLGGITCINEQLIDYNELLKTIGLTNIAEFKLKTMSTSKNFLDILNSKKLNNLFHWVKDNKNLVFNLFSMNYAYYLFSDIVDEALEQYDNSGMYMMMHMPLKNALYCAVKPHFNDIIPMLYKYEYPNVPKNKIYEFSECIMDFVESLQYSEQYTGADEFSIEFLRQILKTMRKKEGFLFLTNNGENEIVSNYSICYSTQIFKFPNASLTFDNEEEVKSNIERLVADKINYVFADSKDEPFLQISDVVVGFFSKLISFLEKVEIDEIEELVGSLNDIQRDTLKLFFEVEYRSCEVCEELLQHVQPFITREKMSMLSNLILS